MKISKSRLETIIKEEVQKFASNPETVVLTEDATAQAIGYAGTALAKISRAGGERQRAAEILLGTLALLNREAADALNAKFEENPDFLDPSKATTRE